MTTKSLFKTTIVCGACIAAALQGCIENSVVLKGTISSIQADTTILLKTGSPDSPTCNIGIDFMYLKPSSEKDSLSQQINQTLQRATFGTDFMKTPIEEVLLDVQKQHITNYRKDLLAFYEADLRRGMTFEEMPPWYNHQYNISSELKLSRDSIYNYAITNFQDTGGAHPMTVLSWTNINANSGKELKKNDVFVEGADKEIIHLISNHLLAEVNQRLETDTITSLKGLWDNGILLNVDLFIPENFLITDEGIRFLYNRYEIAPYVMGDFQLNIPYAEIENLMKIK